MKNLIRYMTFPFLIGLLIFIGTCLLGPGDIPEMRKDLPWDKLAHFGLFFLLSAVSLYDYYRLYNGSPSTLRWLFFGVVLPILYGGLIELLQMYVFTRRSAELGDWYADIGGSFAALLVVFLFLKKRKE